jgi:hypothetical protein
MTLRTNGQSHLILKWLLTTMRLMFLTRWERSGRELSVMLPSGFIRLCLHRNMGRCVCNKYQSAFRNLAAKSMLSLDWSDRGIWDGLCAFPSVQSTRYESTRNEFCYMIRVLNLWTNTRKQSVLKSSVDIKLHFWSVATRFWTHWCSEVFSQTTFRDMLKTYCTSHMLLLSEFLMCIIPTVALFCKILLRLISM